MATVADVATQVSDLHHCLSCFPVAVVATYVPNLQFSYLVLTIAVAVVTSRCRTYTIILFTFLSGQLSDWITVAVSARL